MAAYYNDLDPYCVVFLKNLIRYGLIPDGEVDDRDIRDVQPADLVGFAQVHFFAGIGGWARALRIAEWPEDREVWTGSCPCTPHSSAARGRHVAPDLWGPFCRLIAARTPRVVFGEQVANARGWFDGVCDDLGVLEYEIGAAILPAVAVGHDHARPRLYFVGHANSQRESSVSVDEKAYGVSQYRGHARGLAPQDGVSHRLAALRAYGNAIVPTLAAEFIAAYMEICDAQ